MEAEYTVNGKGYREVTDFANFICLRPRWLIDFTFTENLPLSLLVV